MQEIGLQVAYNANGGNNAIRTYIKRHGSLALIPVAEVEMTLQQLRENHRPLGDQETAAKLEMFDV